MNMPVSRFEGSPDLLKEFNRLYPKPEPLPENYKPYNAPDFWDCEYDEIKLPPTRRDLLCLCGIMLFCCVFWVAFIVWASVWL